MTQRLHTFKPFYTLLTKTDNLKMQLSALIQKQGTFQNGSQDFVVFSTIKAFLGGLLNLPNA